MISIIVTVDSVNLKGQSGSKMGAESSVLKGCVLDKPLDVSLASGWSLQPAKQRDGPSVSVFVNTTTEQVDRAPLRNAAKVYTGLVGRPQKGLLTTQKTWFKTVFIKDIMGEPLS